MSIDYKQLGEFDRHVRVVELNDSTVGLRGYIAIHRQNSGIPSLGGTRVWRYSNEHEALRDALRLSKLMSYKSALVGLPYGGAKAVLIMPENGIINRQKFFAAYVSEVNKLLGVFLTGTDVGVSNDDLALMQNDSSFIIGQGVNSAYFTAIGVLESIRIAFDFLFGSSSVVGRSFAIQGVGNTGRALVDLLVAAGAMDITVADIDAKKIVELQRAYPFVHTVPISEIYSCKVDVFSPSALSGVLNSNTIEQLHCRAVIGSANNQLATPDSAEQLHERGTLYLPDYLVNAGGLISVVDQYRNGVPDTERIIKQIQQIPQSVKLILTESKITSRSPEIIAHALAHSFLYTEAAYVATTT
jgi:leucine dehydrogenase